MESRMFKLLYSPRRIPSFAPIEYPISAAAGHVAKNGVSSSNSPLGLGRLKNERASFSVALH